MRKFHSKHQRRDNSLRVNRQIRKDKVRLVHNDGTQMGIVSLREALNIAQSEGLDLVEVAPSAVPPVCKVIDYGKYKYQLTKKEKENRKSQQQVKIKEIKIKPNIEIHDFETKLKRAREFLEKNFKVKLTCTFWGKEISRTELGMKVMKNFCEALSSLGQIDAPFKRIGRAISTMLVPLKSNSTKTNKNSFNESSKNL